MPILEKQNKSRIILKTKYTRKQNKRILDKNIHILEKN